MEKKRIKVSVEVNTSIEKVWEYWTKPEHIKHWNSASDDWHTVKVDNELNEGGRFTYRMEAKDGSHGFDFSGIYDEIREKELLCYTLDDDREVDVSFSQEDGKTRITEKFEPESENSEELQKEGWQAILSNFKKYAEKN